jgi:hypothetical protein
MAREVDAHGSGIVDAARIEGALAVGHPRRRPVRFGVAEQHQAAHRDSIDFVRWKV